MPMTLLNSTAFKYLTFSQKTEMLSTSKGRMFCCHSKKGFRKKLVIAMLQF
jgi:hypothetical protein